MQLSTVAARPATPRPLVPACVSVPVLALPRGGGVFRAAVLTAPVALVDVGLSGTVGVALRRNAMLARDALGAALLQTLAGAA